MKFRIVLLLASLLLMLVSVSVSSAQDEMMPPCSVQEFTAVAQVVGEIFLGVQDVVALPDSPTPSDFALMVAIFDAYTAGYWEGYGEASEEIACLESAWLGNAGGLLLDEMLIVLSLQSLSMYEMTVGNAEAGEILQELVIVRTETMQANAQAFAEIITGIGEATTEINLDIAYCTQEEIDTTWAGLEPIAEAYLELGELSDESMGGDLSAAIVGYATLSNSYWTEFFPLIPGCFEAQDAVMSAGLLIDESLIAVTLAKLSEYEAEQGDAEVAQALADGALVHLETVMAMAELWFPEEE